MNVREAEITDLDKIIELGKEVEEFNVAEETTTFWPKESIKNLIENEKNSVIIAENESEIFGFVIINYNPNLNKAIIENIYTKKEYRGKGIGKQLLDYSLNILKKKGCSYVCLLVDKNNNNSIEWYERQDFSHGKEFVWFDKILSEDFKK